MEGKFSHSSPYFLSRIRKIGRLKRIEQESRLEQIVVNMMNFMNAIDRSGVEVRDKEMPNLHKLSGVIRVGLQNSDTKLEQKTDSLASECGAIPYFPIWESTNKGKFIVDRNPMHEAIQTYIFR